MSKVVGNCESPNKVFNRIGELSFKVPFGLARTTDSMWGMIVPDEHSHPNFTDSLRDILVLEH